MAVARATRQWAYENGSSYTRPIYSPRASRNGAATCLRNERPMEACISRRALGGTAYGVLLGSRAPPPTVTGSRRLSQADAYRRGPSGICGLIMAVASCDPVMAAGCSYPRPPLANTPVTRAVRLLSGPALFALRAARRGPDAVAPTQCLYASRPQ